MPNYYFGQGKIYLANREVGTGVPLGFSFLGNCPELTIKLSRSAVRFAQSGIEAETALIPKGEPSMISFTLDDFNLGHAAAILSGRTVSLSAASAVDEPIIARLGKTVPLAHMNLTGLPVVTGAGGSPTYTLTTDYTVNQEHGTLTFPTTSTIADNASLLVDYSYGAYDKVAAFTIRPGYWWMRFEGYNIAAQPKATPQVIDFFKIRLRPPPSFAVITEDLRVLEMEASMHFDSNQSDATDNGKLFRIKRYSPT